MPEKPTKKALELRKKPLKEIFGCTDLADREVSRFKQWFKKNYGYSHEKAPEGELATALYSYCARPVVSKLELDKFNKWFKEKTKREFKERIEDIRYMHEFAKKHGSSDFKEATATNTQSLFKKWCSENGVEGDEAVKAFLKQAKIPRLFPLTELKGAAATTWVEFLEEGHDVKNVSQFFGNSNTMLKDLLETRQGQCLAFTSLYTMLAEELGLKNVKPFFVTHYEDGTPAIGEKGHVVPALVMKSGKVVLFDSANYKPNAKYKGELMEKEGLWVSALSNKGVALYDLGKYEAAIKEYDKALEIDPNHVMALTNKGIALKNLGRYEKAIQEYDKALEADPKSIEAHSNKGIALKNLGRYEEAIEQYDKALELAPGNPVITGKRKAAVAALNWKRDLLKLLRGLL